jgi:tetratricopeptide (TPR) repeat protein
VEFLYETSLFPDLEYTFKHGLTYQVAYNSLLTERRRALHAKILESMEGLYGDRMAEQVDRLAHHAFRGEVWPKALTYLRQAGAKAETRSAYREAVSCFEQALTALNQLPQNREMLEQALDVRFDLRTSLFPLGERERVLDYLQEAERLCRELDDQLRRAWVSVYMCHYRWVTGQSAKARDLGHRARSMAETLSHFPLTVTVNYYLGLACLSTGDYQGATTFLHENIESLQGGLIRERFGVAGFPAAMSRSYLAWALAERGEFDEGIVNGQEGMRMAKELDHTWSFVTASWGLASLYTTKGELGRTLDILEHALALSREWSLAALTPGVMGSLGYAYAMSGRVSDGLSMLEEALEAAETSGRLAFHSLLVVHMGEVLALANRLEDAWSVAERALTLARERGERGVEAWALRLLAEIAPRSPSSGGDEAETFYRKAMALANELGMRPLMARCHLGLGRATGHAQNPGEACKHLRGAVELFREMDMRSWLEKAEQALST